MSSPPLELGRLAPLWTASLEQRFEGYRRHTGQLPEVQQQRVAMAAALVESALDMQRIGGPQPADVPALLLGDLCLSRASRLLVDAQDGGLQAAFARVVENAAATAAAGGQPAVPEALRAALTAASRA